MGGWKLFEIRSNRFQLAVVAKGPTYESLVIGKGF
jgi:hypothetical protein